jgi:predicted RNase H-like HicB family nuclease
VESDTTLTRYKGSDEADNDIVIPQVHPNGTSRGELLQQLAEAQEALVQVITAMGRATPHRRDYSVIDDDTITRARNAHHARILKLEEVLAELQQIQEGVVAQQGWQ